MHAKARTGRPLKGFGDIRFSVQVDLLHEPAYWDLGLCSDVGIDSQDRLWVASRRQHPISVWSSADGPMWRRANGTSLIAISFGRGLDLPLPLCRALQRCLPDRGPSA